MRTTKISPASEAKARRPAVWDIVRVDFPYADEPTASRHRPALVVAVWPVDENLTLLWLLMITSARHSAWLHDSPITELAGSGLDRPCVVRAAKVAVLDVRLAQRIGTLAAEDRVRVQAGLREGLASALGGRVAPHT